MLKQSDKPTCFVQSSIDLEPSQHGKLSAYSFVAKDLVAIADHTSSFGHPQWRDTHSPSLETAPLVRKLLSSGASLVGLTKMDQLAYSLVGNVGEGKAPLNPLHPDRFAGGSSSGSASAVASGIADFGIGTDTAGSIRVPAAACGIFGIRPTHGSINSGGVIPLAQSFDVVGLFARKSTVLTEVFRVLAGSQNGSQDIEEILIPRDAFSLLDPELAEIMELSAQSIASSIGARIGEIEFGAFLEPSVADTLARIQGREIWANHSEWIELNSRHLAEDVRIRLERCHQLSLSSADDKLADDETRKKYSADLQALLGQNRVVVMPVMPSLTPRLSSTAEEQKDFRLETFRWVAPASLCGTPQVVIPVQRNASGRIAGASLLGARGSDYMLLDAATAAAGEEPYLTV